MSAAFLAGKLRRSAHESQRGTGRFLRGGHAVDPLAQRIDVGTFALRLDRARHRAARRRTDIVQGCVSCRLGGRALVAAQTLARGYLDAEWKGLVSGERDAHLRGSERAAECAQLSFRTSIPG